MNANEFRKYAHQAVDWVADYLENVEEYPVKSQVKPKEIYHQIAPHPPLKGEPFSELMNDLNAQIMPGISHWQHPNFHAYFPANSSYPSVIAEIITAGIGAQCMIWETSPAAAELEERLMEWLIEILNLPKDWNGVIQDTASTSTLAAILAAREKVVNYEINQQGYGQQKLRVYCSSETHSSVEKAVKIAGIGSDNLVKIAVNDELAMIPGALKEAIRRDVATGFTPCCVIATLGTTGTLAFDPVAETGKICVQNNVWLHVDAAYAGSAMILPEMKWMREGLEFADSFVFNPHKWLFTNFDCSAFYVKDRESLLKTFEILPEYLKTKTRGQVNDYRDWGVPLGRRFRALKLWFVIRTFGVEGMQMTLGKHIRLSEWLEEKVNEHPDFELLTPRKLNMVVFRFSKPDMSEEELNTTNEELVNTINESGEAYLTHTKLNGKYAIRLVTGQTATELKHVEKVWGLISSSVKTNG